MSSPVTRPQFAEGQILQAAELSRLAAVPRGRSERHDRVVHRWGIVNGLTLSPTKTEDSAGNAFSRVFLEPGLALDGYGREILVTERAELSASRLRLAVGSTIKADTLYPVFVFSEYRPINAGANAMSSCSAVGTSGSIEERVGVRFGQQGDETQDQPLPPLSADPSEDEGSSEWLVFVGFVTWSEDAQNFADVDALASARFRPFVGVNAAAVAGDDSTVQLQPKGALLPGDTVFQVKQTEDGPELGFGTFKGIGRPIEPLLTVNAKGDVIAKGALTGKRTGNQVQVESGIASDGVILPLPQGVTDAQVVAGEATVHVQVAPLIDPAHSPDASADYAALVQECRVDAERRVHCRIAWASLPLGAAAMGTFGDALVSGPGAVRFVVAVATSGGAS